MALGPPVATKPSGFAVGFCGDRSPSCHVFHTSREAMIKTYSTFFRDCSLEWGENEVLGSGEIRLPHIWRRFVLRSIIVWPINHSICTRFYCYKYNQLIWRWMKNVVHQWPLPTDLSGTKSWKVNYQNTESILLPVHKCTADMRRHLLTKNVFTGVKLCCRHHYSRNIARWCLHNTSPYL